MIALQTSAASALRGPVCTGSVCRCVRWAKLVDSLKILLIHHMNNICTSIWTSVPAPTAWPAVKFTADGLMPNVLHHAIRLTYFATLSSKPFWTLWNSADSSRAIEFPSIRFPIKVFFGVLTFSPIIPGVYKECPFPPILSHDTSNM